MHSPTLLLESSLQDILSEEVNIVVQSSLKKIGNRMCGKGRFRIYGIGGRHIPQILISLANDLIYANDFIHVLYLS